jgi:hypothetical protein
MIAGEWPEFAFGTSKIGSRNVGHSKMIIRETVLDYKN